RQPVLMAKMLTTIDTLSNGRLICGVGVGWWKQEIEILGAPFHARGRQADEMLRVFKELWTSDRPAFNGEFYRFDDIGFAPKPVQKPHPPIWVGGDSAGAFRRVIELGDGWHASGKTPAERAAGAAESAVGTARGGRMSSGIARPLTGKEFLESLRDGREIWIYGERVEDVTTHPAFRNPARMLARLYDALHDPATHAELTCPTDTGSGGYTHPYFRAPASADDLGAARDALAAWSRSSYGRM